MRSTVADSESVAIARLLQLIDQTGHVEPDAPV